MPAGRPKNWGHAQELTPQNRECYEHYLRCEAVNWRLSDAADPLVQYHARLIEEGVRQAEAELEAGRLRSQSDGLAAFVEALRGGRGSH